MIKERWRNVKGFKGYKISNHGRVKSYKRINSGKILEGTISKGYLKVSLRKNNKGHIFLVHRLVALHFVPNHENKPQVNHIDGDKENNHVSNLEWCTPQENVTHAFLNGKFDTTRSPVRGERHYKTKLKREDVIEMRRLHGEGYDKHQISDIMGVNTSTIYQIVTRGSWTHI